MRNLRIGLSVILLLGCRPELSPQVSVHFRLPVSDQAIRKGARDSPASALQHDCYLVSVSGTLIPNSSSEFPSHIDHECMALGTHSGLQSLASLQEGLTLMVTAGDNRTIRLIGVEGLSSCDATWSEAIGELPPRFHTLGSETIDLSADTTVSLRNSYDSSTANDRAAACAFSPSLSGISPSSGTPGGGELLTITGTGFMSDPLQVLLGSTPCTDVTVVSSTEITCLAPAGTDGETVSVSVQNRGGLPAQTLADAYTYSNGSGLTGFTEWTYVDGGGTGGDGINFQSGNDAFFPSLAGHAGELWASFEEDSNDGGTAGILAKFNSNSSAPDWSYVGGEDGINDTETTQVTLLSAGGQLYATWFAQNGIYLGYKNSEDVFVPVNNSGYFSTPVEGRPRLIEFNNQLWVGVISGGELKLFSFPSASLSSPSVGDTPTQQGGLTDFNEVSGDVTDFDWEVFDGKLWVTWIEGAASPLVYVKRFQLGAGWDGTALTYQRDEITGSFPKTCPRLQVAANRLFLGWGEQTSGVPAPVLIRVSELATDGVETNQDATVAEGLSESVGGLSFDLAMESHNGNLYVSWAEDVAQDGNHKIQIRSHVPVSAPGTWGAPSGAQVTTPFTIVNARTGAIHPVLKSFGGYLFLAFSVPRVATPSAAQVRVLIGDDSSRASK